MNRMTRSSTDLTWIANQIFTAYPDEVSGLKLCVLDCGCIYYQRIFPSGELDQHVGIYRNADNGPCKICMDLNQEWQGRVTEEALVYSSALQFRGGSH
jgi:hypothetical protein